MPAFVLMFILTVVVCGESIQGNGTKCEASVSLMRECLSDTPHLVTGTKKFCLPTPTSGIFFLFPLSPLPFIYIYRYNHEMSPLQSYGEI